MGVFQQLRSSFALPSSSPPQLYNRSPDLSGIYGESESEGEAEEDRDGVLARCVLAIVPVCIAVCFGLGIKL